MYIDSNKKSNRIWVRLCIAILILTVCYLGYYKYQQSKLKFQPPEGFSIEVNTKDLTIVGEKWLEEYIKQYQRKYVPRNKKIAEYSIDNIKIKETNVIQVDFSIVPKKLNEKSTYNWNGVIEENKIKSQWILWLKEEVTQERTFIYTVTKLQRPAGYDLEKYQTSGEKERDEYKYVAIEEVWYK